MADDSKVIGKGACPVCSSMKATFTLSKKGLVCCTCMACSCQVFARSERSDELLRKRIEGAPAPKPADPAPPKAKDKEKEKDPAPPPAGDTWDVYA